MVTRVGGQVKIHMTFKLRNYVEWTMLQIEVTQCDSVNRNFSHLVTSLQTACVIQHSSQWCYITYLYLPLHSNFSHLVILLWIALVMRHNLRLGYIIMVLHVCIHLMKKQRMPVWKWISTYIQHPSPAPYTPYPAVRFVPPFELEVSTLSLQSSYGYINIMLYVCIYVGSTSKYFRRSLPA